MLTAIEAAHAMRKTADWIEDSERDGEKCRHAFYRHSPCALTSVMIAGERRLTPFNADSWCAVGRFIYECGEAHELLDHDQWLGGGEITSQIERWFDHGQADLAAHAIRLRASWLEEAALEAHPCVAPALARA